MTGSERGAKNLDLMGLAAGPERPQSAAARHSENTYDLTALSDGPVKGMTFREARAVPEFGGLFGLSDPNPRETT